MEAPAPKSRSSEASQEANNACLAVGNQWSGRYEVVEQLKYSSQTGRRYWSAKSSDERIEAILIELPTAELEHRLKVASKLTEAPIPHLQHLLHFDKKGTEAHEQATGQTLLAWRNENETVSDEMIHTFVAQIGEAIHGLHSRELVHLHIDPETIRVNEGEDGQLSFQLTGIEDIQSFQEAEDLSLTIDPYYAPPEAIGIPTQTAGPHMRTWDWWSFGRTIQTLILGQPVLGAILGRDITPILKDFSRKAADLTTERLNGVLHAGAVESMGKLDPRHECLLKGLLTYSMKGRWRWERLSAWLEGSNPSTYYTLSRNTRLFEWNDHAYLVPDAAAELSKPENWEASIHHLLDAEDSGTLAHYIKSPYGDAEAAQKLQSFQQLVRSVTFEDYPEDLVKEIISAVAISDLAQCRLHWRGMEVNREMILSLLKEDVDENAFTAIQLLTRPKIIQQVRIQDSTTIQLLKNLATSAEEAEEILGKLSFFDSSKIAERKVIWATALTDPDTLRATQAALKAEYISSGIPEIDTLLNASNPKGGELVVLQLSSLAPEAYQYLSHLDHAKAQARELRGKGERLRRALFWMRLGKASKAGFWLFSHMPYWLTGLCAFSIAGLISKPGPLWAMLSLSPVVLAVLFRSILQDSIANFVAESIPKVPRWKWKDGARRCKAERKKLTEERLIPRVKTRIKQVNTSLAELTILEPPPEPIVPNKFPLKVWIASLSSWLVLGTLSLFFAWTLYSSPPSLEEIKAAWGISSTKAESENSIEVNQKQLSTIADDSKGAKAEKAPEPELNLEKEYALKRGRALAAANSIQEGSGEPIAVRLPTGDGVRLMLYDPKTNTLLQDNVFEYPSSLTTGETIQVNGIEVRYLGD